MLREVFRRGWPEVSTGAPQRIKKEVQRFLECGELRFGFVEVSCDTCSESRLVAFSCKGRGWCPSCATRRALETGAQMEAFLPRVAHRQWTLSLPFALRFQVVKQPGLLKRIEVRLVKAVWRWQRRAAKRLGATGAIRGGGICFWQWFGSSLQLTPHLHLLVPEALWSKDGDVVHVPPPTDDDVTAILQRLLRQSQVDFADAGSVWADDDYEVLQHTAIQERLKLPTTPSQRRRRVAVVNGFSLHADTAVHGNDRAGLERLCRYGARGPVAECRLRRLENGCYEYTPKRGVTFTLTAAKVVKRLVALVPPPRRHLTCFHGVYAPNSKLRPVVSQHPQPSPQTVEAASGLPEGKKKRTKRRLDWATLHQRTFGNEVLACPCGGRRSIRALHATRKSAEARLGELGIQSITPAPPKETAPPQLTLAV